MRDIIAEYKNGIRDFSGAYLRGADLGGAHLGGAHLRGADLGGASLRGASLGGADLGGADLGGASLRGADLRGADLGGASLRGVSLGGAYLYGANLGNQWIVQGGTRSDGYQFMLTNFTDEGVRVKAGCRNFTWAQAIAHWTDTRPIGTPLGDETHTLLANLWDLAVMRKLSWKYPTNTVKRPFDLTTQIQD
jgi:uncharacterized protein YjbI with pentapeptide repeats